MNAGSYYVYILSKDLEKVLTYPSFGYVDDKNYPSKIESVRWMEELLKILKGMYALEYVSINPDDQSDTTKDVAQMIQPGLDSLKDNWQGLWI